MANGKNSKLTAKQEKFVDGILEGKTQRQAYYAAYPSSKKWKESVVDSKASELMRNGKVLARLEELGWKDKTKVMWTRQKALETINYVMEMNKKDIERINEAYQTEIDIKQAELLEYVQLMTQEKNPNEVYRISKQMQEITTEIAKMKKQRRVSGTNMHGIYEGAKILNRMFGYDITKVEITQEDQERENMKELSVEELKAIAYANIDKGNTEKS